MSISNILRNNKLDIYCNTITANAYNVDDLNVTDITAQTIETDSITATTGNITNITSSTGTITNLSALTAEIVGIDAEGINVSEIDVTATLSIGQLATLKFGTTTFVYEELFYAAPFAYINPGTVSLPSLSISMYKNGGLATIIIPPFNTFSSGPGFYEINITAAPAFIPQNDTSHSCVIYNEEEISPGVVNKIYSQGSMTIYSTGYINIFGGPSQGTSFNGNPSYSQGSTFTMSINYPI